MAFFRTEIYRGRTIEDYLESSNIRSGDYKKFEVSDIKSSDFRIDIDGDGNDETVTVDGIMNFDDRIIRLVNDGMPEYNGMKWSYVRVTDLTSFMGGPLTIYVGDFDKDGREDYVFSFTTGIVVYKNVTEEGFLSGLVGVELHSEDVTAVPDFERSGDIHVSRYMKNDEQLSEHAVTVDDLRELLLENSIEFPKAVIEKLPKEFFVGTIGIDTPWDRLTFGERLEEYGFEVEADIDDAWPQDIYEAILIAGESGRIDLNDYNLEYSDGRTGGNVQFIKNDEGKIFVTVDIETVRFIQESLYLSRKEKLISFNDALRVIGSIYGLSGERVLALPKISEFAHLDQQFVNIGDGKIIAVKIPAMHPQYNDWLIGVGILRKNGFNIVGEIELPEYYMKMSRSPLNMLIHNDEDGNRHYVLPVDPVFLFNAKTGDHFDLRTSEGESYRSFCPSIGEEADEKFMAIYDPNNIAPHIQKLYRILVQQQKIDPQYVHFFYYNYSCQGSVHCRTNQDVK